MKKHSNIEPKLIGIPRYPKAKVQAIKLEFPANIDKNTIVIIIERLARATPDRTDNKQACNFFR